MNLRIFYKNKSIILECKRSNDLRWPHAGASSIIQQQESPYHHSVGVSGKFGHQGVLNPCVGGRPGLRRIFQREIVREGDPCQDYVISGIDGQSVSAVTVSPTELGGIAQGGAAWVDLHEDGIIAPSERREQRLLGVWKILGRLHRIVQDTSLLFSLRTSGRHRPVMISQGGRRRPFK
jgi:hypothetical protein